MSILTSKKFRRMGIPGLTAVIFASAVSSSASETSVQNPASMSSLRQQCEALVHADFSTVPDAPTQIVSAEVSAGEKGREHCRINGYVNPQVGFELLLPLSGWNSKFIHRGSGGHGGSFYDACTMPLARGYACLQSDMGHKGGMFEAKWAYNNLQAKLDFGHRAAHVATLAGKAIIQAFYQKPLLHSYFVGGSMGGRQALQEAQRFPWDFDGIVAIAPPIRLVDLNVTFAWGQRVTHDAAGRPLLTMADLKLLTDGALARCDGDDGVRDEIISSPFECPFRASDLACKPQQTTSCLTPEKVKAAEQVYSGPVDAQGRSLFGAGAPPGSEYGTQWNAEFGGNWGVHYLGKDGNPAMYSALAEDGLKYLLFSPDQAPSWTLRDFDFDRDYKRLDVMESFYDSSNPDLSRFKAAGGKLLIIHGLNDLAILPQWIIRYYEKVERVMGGREQTQAFVRLFSLPGVDHHRAGPGASEIDSLTYLERWVEQKVAPDKLIAYHLKKVSASPPTFPIPEDEIEFSRPVYPYPIKARYLGHGDPNQAASFGPTHP